MNHRVHGGGAPMTMVCSAYISMRPTTNLVVVCVRLPGRSCKYLFLKLSSSPAVLGESPKSFGRACTVEPGGCKFATSCTCSEGVTVAPSITPPDCCRRSGGLFVDCRTLNSDDESGAKKQRRSCCAKERLNVARSTLDWAAYS